MTWMAKWVGGHPVYAASARGASVIDVDGHTYVDFALGDTGAMAGHSRSSAAASACRCGASRSRRRTRTAGVGPAVDPTVTTRVCEFNDLDAVQRLLADEQVACVLTEPALTNIGIVPPDEGFLAGLRAACDAAGTLLIIDETHTLSAGPGGCTAAWDLEPDPPRSGGASAGLHDTELEDALHLFMLNRGIIISQFHNMALMCPATTAAYVDRHTDVFAEAVAALVG
jgi:glutamate-1-semialdehyde aminotransferase